MADLRGKKVAVLVDNYFEESEFTEPIKDLKAAGATIEIVAPKVGPLQAMNHAEISETYHAEKSLDDVKIDEYDALLIPGGAVNADQLRMNDKARIWVKKFLDMGRPVAVICHGPWVLASAGIAKDRRLTSFFTIQDDMRNAGAQWVDEEVVIDGNLITSRQPDDIPAFDKALITMMQAA
jgi:protease I